MKRRYGDREVISRQKEEPEERSSEICQKIERRPWRIVGNENLREETARIHGWYPQATDDMLTYGFDKIIVEENLGPGLEGCVEILHQDKEVKCFLAEGE